MSDSRRGILAPHAHDRATWTRCPICQWAIEQDHAEALAMHAARADKPPRAGRTVPASTAIEETEGTLEFALL